MSKLLVWFCAFAILKYFVGLHVLLWYGLCVAAFLSLRRRGLWGGIGILGLFWVGSLFYFFLPLDVYSSLITWVMHWWN